MGAAERGIPPKRAARALGVGRNRVLAMVERGELERAADGGIAPHSLARALAGPSGPPAPALITATEPAPPPGTSDSGRAFRELVEPMLQQLVDARGEAAGLRARLALIDQDTRRSQQRDELLAALVAGTWRQRRRAHRAALTLLARGR